MDGPDLLVPLSRRSAGVDRPSPYRLLDLAGFQPSALCSPWISASELPRIRRRRRSVARWHPRLRFQLPLRRWGSSPPPCPLALPPLQAGLALGSPSVCHLCPRSSSSGPHRFGESAHFLFSGVI